MRQYTDTTSHWIDSASMPWCSRLGQNTQVDVVVVGGGITGLTAAYLLTKAGRSVAVLERERLAQIDTGHTSAHLTMVTDTRLQDLVKTFGADHARATWDAGLAAIAQIDRIIVDEDVDCDFEWVPGYLHGPLAGGSEVVVDPQRRLAEEVSWFEEEATLARELGFDVSFAEDVPFIGGPGVRFADQARFHPRKYLGRLARAIEANGGKIHENSPAAEFSKSPRSVKANGHTITCEHIIIATHDPILGNADASSAGWFQTKLALYSTYVVGGRGPKGRVPDGLFWDTTDPYHYLRIEPHRDHDFVIFGGEDHKTGQAADTNVCYERLERALATMVPGIDLTHRWSGQVIETPDGLPFIGETADHQFAATGFSGNGMTFGTLGAMMMVDRILSRDNPWRELFDTGRTKIRGGAWNYIRENKDYPYYKIRDRFAGAETRSLRAVKPGQGKIIDRGGQLVAAYREPDGTVIMRSANCTHMGCVVDWNEAERTWDCPCHGSRFKPDGAVISGPAESPLPEL